jgi:hypothetical protein
MRNLLAFVGAAILTFLALGYYLGWYNIIREPSSTGHSKLEVDINQEKVAKDVQQGVEKGGDKVKEFLDSNQQQGNSTPPTITPLPPDKSAPSPFFPPTGK